MSRSRRPSRNELLPPQVAAQVSERQVIPAPSIGSRVICKAPLRAPVQDGGQQGHLQWGTS